MDDKSWLEVFDCYFGNKKEQYDFDIPERKHKVINLSELIDNDDLDELPESIVNILDEIKKRIDDGESPEDMFDDNLGTPDSTMETFEGNIHFIKKVWNREGGNIVKIEAQVREGKNYEDLTISEKIELAIQNEDYELAKKLKDEQDTNFLNNITSKDE